MDQKIKTIIIEALLEFGYDVYQNDENSIIKRVYDKTIDMDYPMSKEGFILILDEYSDVIVDRFASLKSLD
jgi:hypothetical protein